MLIRGVLIGFYITVEPSCLKFNVSVSFIYSVCPLCNYLSCISACTGQPVPSW